mmetsp:Transcript_27253/g.91177  ORF Transcript_27253/g.91177 Transcript_27253/m.91177 type:complete len:202 (-) Transcript_27253:241-846(-)
MSRMVALWKAEVAAKNEKAAAAIADPEEYPNLFENLDVALKAEQWLEAQQLDKQPAAAYAAQAAHAEEDGIALFQAAMAGGGAAAAMPSAPPDDTPVEPEPVAPEPVAPEPEAPVPAEPMPEPEEEPLPEPTPEPQAAEVPPEPVAAAADDAEPAVPEPAEAEDDLGDLDAELAADTEGKMSLDEAAALEAELDKELEEGF